MTAVTYNPTLKCDGSATTLHHAYNSKMYNYKVTTSSAEWRRDMYELDADRQLEYRRRDAKTGEDPGTVSSSIQ